LKDDGVDDGGGGGDGDDTLARLIYSPVYSQLSLFPYFKIK
jgi:hypothetical protein